MNERHNLRAKKKKNSMPKALVILPIKNCTVCGLFTPREFVRNQHDYETYLRRKCQGIENILSIEEARVKFNKDLLSTCSVLSSELGTQNSSHS